MVTALTIIATVLSVILVLLYFAFVPVILLLVLVPVIWAIVALVALIVNLASPETKKQYTHTPNMYNNMGIPAGAHYNGPTQSNIVQETSVICSSCGENQTVKAYSVTHCAKCGAPLYS